jgi:putative membrane protein
MSTTHAAVNALTAVASTADRHFVGWGPGFGWWVLLIPLFWILVFALLFALFGRRWRRAARENGYGPHGRLSPLRQAEVTLAERYANGDIDEVEYRARLEVLRANAAPPS